jgi:hypothetical protein
MKKKSNLAQNYKELKNFFSIINKNKYFILFMSSLFPLIFFINFLIFNPKEYKSEVNLVKTSDYFFEFYNLILTQERDPRINDEFRKNTTALSSEFEKNLNNRLKSAQNINSFLENSKEFENFKSFLKSRNISAAEYFSNYRMHLSKEDNTFYLIFPKELEGNIFLDKYIIYTVEKEKKNFLDAIKKTTNNLNNYYQILLDVADTRPAQKGMTFNDFIFSNRKVFIDSEDALSLRQKILINQKINKMLENINPDINFTLSNATNPQLYSKFRWILLFTSFLIGIFFSLIVIFIRSENRKLVFQK